MKYLIIIIILFINKNILALELTCLFEEVHQNGESHQGVILIKNEKFRYQYFSRNLYTIIHKDNLSFYVQNNDKTKFFKINDNSEVLEGIVNILDDFPNIKKEYYIGESIIKVEYSKTNKLIKRIIILSEEVNMSVYFKECKNPQIKDFHFSWSPFWDYTY